MIAWYLHYSALCAKKKRYCDRVRRARDLLAGKDAVVPTCDPLSREGLRNATAYEPPRRATLVRRSMQLLPH